MTRETKVGAIVAISFLSLVGVVIFSKWRGRGEEEKESQPTASLQPPTAAQGQSTEGQTPKKPQAEGNAATPGPIANTNWVVPLEPGAVPSKLPGAAEESQNPAVPAVPPLPPPAVGSNDDRLK